MNRAENRDRKLGISDRNSLSNTLKKLCDWIVPPQVTSEEVSRKAQLMAKIVLSMVATNTIGFVAALFEPKNKLSVTVAFYGLVYAALIAFVVILRHGKIKLAGWSLIIFMWC